MKKVTDKELEKLKGYVSAINESQATIGGMEMRKHALVTETEKLIAELKATQKELEEKYGDITVSLTTGEITDADN